MKKLLRLIEIKRQLRLTQERLKRAAKKEMELVHEKTKVLASFTQDEKRLYKERIERACR